MHEDTLLRQFSSKGDTNFKHFIVDHQLPDRPSKTFLTP